MKFTHLLALLILVGCKHEIEQSNQFNSTSDTLILQTNRIKGYGLFQQYAYPINFQDLSESDNNKDVFPDNISDLKIAKALIDFKPYTYNNLKSNNSKHLETFLKNYFPRKIDTANIPSEGENSINIISGNRGTERIYVIDENNNKDFRDDSIRICDKLNFDANPIRCNYNIYDGKEIVKDSGWVNVGVNINNELSISVAHRSKSTFSIDNNFYEVQIVNGPPFLRFCFENPILALTVENEVKKDSLRISEIIDYGEYLSLGGSYYRFEDVSNDGGYISLVKEEDVSKKIGTQIGFIAPDFTSITIEGDTISLKDYKGKNLLLVNITACWSPIMSYEFYKELTEEYGSSIEILAIDNSPIFLKQNIKELNLTGKFIIANDNQSIENNYREDYCSRTCFMINSNGRIEDKFEISDWKKALASHFN